MKVFRLCCLITIVAAAAALGSAQSNGPVDAVRSFYALDRNHSKWFTSASIEARKKWFSADLYNLFLNELKREKEFLRRHPGEKTYFADGLPFRPYDEICNAERQKLHKQLKFDAEAVDARSVTVIVTFAYPPPCKEPDDTVYKLKMIKTPGGWVIDNVVYDADSDLVRDLKRKDY